MLVTYKNLEKIAITLNDLAKINGDRIDFFEQALNNSNNINIDKNVKHLFERMISEGNEYRTGLINKVNELVNNSKSTTTIQGVIYRIWSDLKTSFMGITSHSVTSFCTYNEQIVLHTYKAALNLSEKIDGDVKELIMHQRDAIKGNCELLKIYKETRYYSDSRLVYFN